MFKIAHEDEVPWGHGARHRSSNINYKPMISGEEGAVDNYKLNIGKVAPEFFSPRHRHNFDQVRFVLEGRVSIGPKVALTAGQIGYFPEGVPYGPQTQDNGAVNMVIQCGGASGQGFMTPEQVSRGYETLLQHGRFDGGVFYRSDGSTVVHKSTLDAYEAIWEFTNGRPLDYPKPRFEVPIIMRPENFEWQPHSKFSGVWTKVLGVFGERSFEIALIRIEHASLMLAPRGGRRLLFVVEGTGELGDRQLRRHSAVEVPTGMEVSIASNEALVLLVVGLPIFTALPLTPALQSV